MKTIAVRWAHHQIKENKSFSFIFNVLSRNESKKTKQSFNEEVAYIVSHQ